MWCLLFAQVWFQNQQTRHRHGRKAQSTVHATLVGARHSVLRASDPTAVSEVPDELSTLLHYKEVEAFVLAPTSKPCAPETSFLLPPCASGTSIQHTSGTLGTLLPRLSLPPPNGHREGGLGHTHLHCSVPCFGLPQSPRSLPRSLYPCPLWAESATCRRAKLDPGPRACLTRQGPAVSTPGF